eukprot:314120_1
MADSYPFLDEGEVENPVICIIEDNEEEGMKDTTGSIINCSMSECNRKSIKKCHICNTSYVCCQHCRAYEKDGKRFYGCMECIQKRRELRNGKNEPNETVTVYKVRPNGVVLRRRAQTKKKKWIAGTICFVFILFLFGGIVFGGK